MEWALNETSCLRRSLWIPNREVYLGVLVLYMVYCSLARDFVLSINITYKIGCCDWFLIHSVLRWMIMSCVTKPSYTHEIIVSLCLICCIQCEFSISYLSILGIVAHDRTNISQIFTFFVQFQCPMWCRAFYLYNCLFCLESFL